MNKIESETNLSNTLLSTPQKVIDMFVAAFQYLMRKLWKSSYSEKEKQLFGSLERVTVRKWIWYCFQLFSSLWITWRIVNPNCTNFPSPMFRRQAGTLITSKLLPSKFNSILQFFLSFITNLMW